MRTLALVLFLFLPALALAQGVPPSAGGKVLVPGTTTPRSLTDRLSETINAKDFGAKGDGVTDDWAALNAAVVAGRTQKKPVVVPPGDYLISRPLQIRTSNESLVGLGGVPSQTKIRAPSVGWGWFGPAVVVAADPPANQDFDYTDALVTSSTGGRAFQLASDNSQPYFNVRDLQYGGMAGLGQFRVEFFIRRTGATSGVIISSSCTLKKGDTQRIPFHVGVTDFNGGSIRVNALIGATQHQFDAPFGTLPLDSTVRHVRVAYDGSKIGIAVNGVWVAQQAASGALDMRAYEDLLLFAQASRPHGYGVINFAPTANVQSVHLNRQSGGAVGTNFTAPSSQHVGNGSTMILLNGEAANVDGAVVKTYTLGNSSYLLTRTHQIPQPFTEKNTVANLFIKATGGTALISYGSIQSTFRDLVLEGWNGFEIGNNSFLARLNNVVINYFGRFGIKHDPGTGVVQIDRLEIFGGGDNGNDPWAMSYFLAGSSVLVTNAYLSAVRWGFFVIGVSGQMTVAMNFINITDEGAMGTQDIDSAVYLEDVLAFSALGSTFEIKKYAAIIVKAAGNTRAAWIGSIFTANQSATKIFETVGPSPAVSHTALECNRWSSDGGATEAQVPWGDNVGVVRAGVLVP